MYHEVKLPLSLGNREQVQELFRAQGVPDSLDGEPLVVRGSALQLGWPTAADELVRAALLHRRASALILCGTHPEFVAHIRHAAGRRGMGALVQLRKYAELAP